MDVRDRFNVLLERAGLCREGDAICRRNGTRTIKMSNFLVVPTADVEKSDGCTVRRFAEVAVYVCRGEEIIVTEAVTISMTELNNMEWVWQRWGLLCHIYPPLNTNKEYLRRRCLSLRRNCRKDTFIQIPAGAEFGTIMFLRTTAALSEVRIFPLNLKADFAVTDYPSRILIWVLWKMR